MMINFIIVDDEIAAHENIKDFASGMTSLTHQKSCYNAFEAIEYLNHHSVDLMFLDMKMPKLSGFDFLKTLPYPPRVIVTTAHKEFALEGYDLNIDDYLLKPFSLTRFIHAVNRATVHIQPKKASNSGESIFLKDNKKYHHVILDDILFVEAYGNYVKIYLTNKMLITHQTLSSVEALLPNQNFVKVHKSFIISKSKIVLVESNGLQIQNHRIPIGKRYRENVEQLLT